MKKIVLYSALLLTGLALSQILPRVWPGLHAAAQTPTKLATMFCLAYIMIRVGFEFQIDKSRLGMYAWDYLIAATAAAFPWIFCAIYFVFVMSPPAYWTSLDAWKETLLISRFAAPTSAGILFSMLAAAGLTATWVYRKARILAIFDDLDTVLLMIPLKILMVGLKWQLIALAGVIAGLLSIAWKWLHTRRWPSTWPWVMGYSALITLACEAVYVGSLWINDEAAVHLEVLLPAFVLGCLIAEHPDESDASETRTATAITATFMILVGLTMPPIVAGAGDAMTQGQQNPLPSAGGAWPGWIWIAVHVAAVTVLSNLGKMFSLLCYRNEASWKDRLALSIGMWPRGEVGAGVLVVSLAYGISGPAVTVAMLSLALNLMCTGFFIAAVRSLLMTRVSREP